ncbi:hypothetical protein D1007_41376 [Hordeum vulgare]|nr:hypothetical protein D1007_41376 [Hordeum vulgare]
MVIEEGYTEADYMFYVKNEGQGSAGLQVIDTEDVVEEMLDQYDPEKLLNITVIKATEPNPGDLNIANLVRSCMLFLYVLHNQVNILIFLNTRDGMNLKKAKGKAREYYGPSDDEGFVDFNYCEYKPEEHNIAVEEENEIIDQLKQMRKHREDHVINFEGDTKVEEMCPKVEDSDIQPETTLPLTFKIVGKAGPTTRSHKQAETKVIPDFTPSNDSGCFPRDYGISDSDEEAGIEAIPLPCGRKSQARRDKTRKWYDETRPNAHEELCLKLCFTNVY